MSSGKKTVLALVAIAAMLACAALAVFVILVSDEPPPPDDSDLVLCGAEVPAERNAWTYYSQAFEKLKLPQKGEDADWPPAPPPPATAGGKPADGAAKGEPGELPPDLEDRWDAIVDNVAWEQPLVDEVLRRNAEALALWEKGLAAPECLVPETVPPMGTVPWHSDVYAMTRLTVVRIRNLSRQGNDEAAMDEAMRMVRFGHHLEGGRGLIVVYRAGATIKQMGLDEMIELVQASRVSPVRLRQIAAELVCYQVDPKALADALRVEYSFGRVVAEQIASGQCDAKAVLHLYPSSDSWRMVFFKPNRTRRIMTESFRKMVCAAPTYWSKAPLFHTMALEEDRFAKGNYVGAMLCWMYVVNAEVADLKCETNVHVAVTRALLAMRAFKLEKGRLPATLGELVPEYLDAVPLDDFDGKPLRYNPAKKIIYSVGKDLRDEGGMTKKEYVDYKVKTSLRDPSFATPDRLKSFEDEYPDSAPDPSYPIEF